MASKWNLVKDSYDCFGFNLFDPKTIMDFKVQIFGDEDNM